MEVVEDVGPIDGDWVVVLVHHTDHALVRRTTMSANAVRHLIVVLYTEATHHATQLLKVVPGIQAAGEAREVREAVVRDHAGILDPHAAEADQVQAGLDGHHVALGQRLFVRPSQRRLLVHIKPNAVARAVVHLGSAVRALVTLGGGPVTAVDEDLAHRVVHVAAGDACLDGFDARVQRLKDGGITSASNESSVVLYGSFERGNVLLTGDAGINGLTT